MTKQARTCPTCGARLNRLEEVGSFECSECGNIYSPFILGLVEPAAARPLFTEEDEQEAGSW